MQELAERLNEDIEFELEWRVNELELYARPLRYSIFNTHKEESIYYKSLLAMLYAHFEGYSKFCFLSYINSINSLKLQVSDVLPQISVHALNHLFEKLENTNNIEPALNSECYNNAPVQKIWRRIEFCKNSKFELDQELVIDEKVVSTKSNLDASVLRLILYKLGFPLDAFNEYRGSIQKLIGYRNIIAHGGKVTTDNFKDEYSGLNTEILDVMLKLKNLLVRGINDLKYLNLDPHN